jgi:hypothetical protein
MRRKSYMQRLRALPLSASICILIVSFAVVVGVSALDLDPLTHDSDLILVGKVISVHEIVTTRVTVFSEEYRAHVLVGMMHVDRILKGAIPSDIVSFKFYLPETFVGWQPVSPTPSCIFLQSRCQRRTGVYESLLPVSSGTSSASSAR